MASSVCWSVINKVLVISFFTPFLWSSKGDLHGSYPLILKIPAALIWKTPRCRWTQWALQILVLPACTMPPSLVMWPDHTRQCPSSRPFEVLKYRQSLATLWPLLRHVFGKRYCDCYSHVDVSRWSQAPGLLFGFYVAAGHCGTKQQGTEIREESVGYMKRVRYSKSTAMPSTLAPCDFIHCIAVTFSMLICTFFLLD